MRGPHLSWKLNSKSPEDVRDGVRRWRLKNLEYPRLLRDGKGGTDCREAESRVLRLSQWGCEGRN